MRAANTGGGRTRRMVWKQGWTKEREEMGVGMKERDMEIELLMSLE